VCEDRFGIAFSGSTLGFKDGLGEFCKERTLENFKLIAEKS